MTTPVLQQMLPLDNATGVSVSTNIAFGFNEGVRAGSGFIHIYKSDGTLFHSIDITDTSQVTFSTVQPARVQINPNIDLVAGTNYYVLLDAGAIEDLTGFDFGGISSATQLNFKTAGTAPAGDTVAPLLSLTSPADNATNVGVASNLVLTFNETVKAGAGNIEIRKISDGSLVTSIAVTDATQLAFSGNQLTINPTGDLALGTGYYVTFASGVVLDLANNAFGGISSSTAFNFTTVAAPDITAPLLTDISPDDDATGVAVGSNLILTFDEAVKAGAGFIAVRKVSDGSLVKNISIADATQVSISGNQVTLNPLSDLAPGVQYYVTFSSGVILDLSNNPFDGISSTTAFTFTTAGVLDETAPLMMGTLPADNATNVSISANLVVTFNEPIKFGSGTVIIYNANTNAMVELIASHQTSLFTVSGNQLTINPVNDLASNTSYYITFSAGLVRDPSDNAFEGSFSPTTFNFTTSNVDTIAPVLMGSAPFDNATGVAPNSNLALIFNETIKIGSGNILIRNAATGNIEKTIAVTDASQVSVTGNQLTVNPTTDLAAATPYYVTLASGAVLDLVNNPYGGFSAATAFNFKTGSTSSPLPQSLLKSGAEFLVNSTTDNNQANPVVASLTDGRFIVTWSDFSANGDDPGGSVRAQMFSANGTKLGSELLVNTLTYGVQASPTVAALTNGGFVIAWVDVSSLDVRAQIFAADGNRSGVEFLVTTSSGVHIGPALTALSNGRFVAIWEEAGAPTGDLSDYGIHAQLFDAVGNAIGSEFLVNTTTYKSQEYPAITALANGGFVAAWTDLSIATHQSASATRAQIYDQDGNAIGAELLVSSGVSSQDGPAVLGLADDRFVVFWKVLGVSTASIYGQVFNPNGSKSGDNFLVSNTVTSDAGTARPEVAEMLDDGRFVVTWSNWNQSTQDADVRAQVFNSDGSKSGAELVANTTVAAGQFWPSLSVLSNGNVAVVWTDFSETGGDTSVLAIRGQIFTLPAELVLTGNNSVNNLVGGAGNDIITGFGRGDILTGGGGVNTFVYNAAADSTGTNRDTIADFNASADTLDLWYHVTGVDTAVTNGSIRSTRFDSDLASAINASKLGSHHAVLFTPNAGVYAGQTFLIVDANGNAGYQGGADLVIVLGNASDTAGLTIADFV